MVLTDSSQLIAECSEWRQILRNYKEEFLECKKALEQSCRQTHLKDQLQQVEQFNNQFYIQLINIHDLKQSIKAHERKVNFELATGHSANTTFAYHEDILDQFFFLENRLQELREEFKNFINRQ